MTGGCDEVQTGVDASIMVRVQSSLDLQFLLEEVLKLFVDVLHDRLVASEGRKENEIGRFSK